MREGIYGEDILLDQSMQAVVRANVALAVSEGTQTALQDIKLRLFTPLGGLFYDSEFGSGLIEFVKDENTVTNRLALAAEVKRRINMDPRVTFGSVSCEVLSWDHTGVILETLFELIDETHPFNLIIEIGGDMEMVVKDGNPD